jgi:hypothetical protein
MLLSYNAFPIVNNFVIGNFNTFSCHAPLMVDFKLKGLSLNDICTCKVVKYKAYNWNEWCKDDVKRDLLVNSSIIDDLMNNINVDTGNIDDIVNEMNVILSNIAKKETY